MCMKKSVFSELPTIIATFLVLNIPLNLLQNRKRVRQRALRFREFHLHSTKRTLPYSFVQPAWGRSGRGR